MKRAIVFGASGFVGSHLLLELLDSPDYRQVTAVVRRELGVTHPKLRTLLGDLDSLASLGPDLEADEIFLALGTTRQHTPDRGQYYRIDHDYPLAAARMAKERGAGSVFLVSAVGADAGSRIFYARTKGELERDLVALGFDHTHIFRPSMILGHRAEFRPQERLLVGIWTVVNALLVGPLDRYKGLSGPAIAQAMAAAAAQPREKVAIYHWREMAGLIGGNSSSDHR
jgi:uncharacterized protein YbjT (DUF2867 family)